MATFKGQLYIEKASASVPLGLTQMLCELGDGENGFSGTSFGRGTATLDEFLQACRDGENTSAGPGFVPQTVFWMIDDGGRAVGMVRVRHCLNERLFQSGGHIGYYVRPCERGKGYATQALRLAVNYFGDMGVDRALITVSPSNTASNRVAIANGGKIDSLGRNPDTGETVNRYWIELPEH